MKKLQRTVFRSIAVFLCLATIGAYGQKQTKTYKEIFNVGDEAVLDINTSHADITFETWDKNQVQIEALIEIEGVSTEEAERYFKNGGIRIVGNSKTIEITTGTENMWSYRHAMGDLQDLHIEIPEIPDLENLFLALPALPELPELPELPPMPIFPMQDFDYKAFEKDGEKYLKKWKKEFNESFDEDYKRKLEEWSKEAKARAEEMKNEREQMKKEHKRAMEEREIIIEERKREIGKEGDSTKYLFIQQDSIHNNAPNIFYWSTEGKNKNLKVKKTIKIKMPKSTRLKMNVRHGEVKLAENTKNINATLSYARLLASTIEGDKTTIMVSYSPVSVQKWNYGQLKTDYSEKVDLKEVTELRLSANSSDITIGRLLKSAYIKNNFGPLRINSVSKNFTDIDISLQNAELVCKVPPTPFTIYVNGTASKFAPPASLALNKTKNHNSVLYKGYHINKNSDKSIIISSKYSEVVLE